MQRNKSLSKRMIPLVIFLVAAVAVIGCSDRQQIPWSGSYVGVSIVQDPNDHTRGQKTQFYVDITEAETELDITVSYKSSEGDVVTQQAPFSVSVPAPKDEMLLIEMPSSVVPYDRYAEEPTGDLVYLEMMMDEDGNIQFKYANDEDGLSEKEYVVLAREAD